MEAIREQAKKEARKQYARNQGAKYERLAEHSLDEENRRGYALKAANWRKESDKYELTQWWKDSKINSKGENMSLEYQRYGRNKETVINSTYINSGEYRNKFNKITEDANINRILFTKAKEMLRHRSGTMFEDMYWIDGDTGKVIASALDEKTEERIVYTSSLKKALYNRENLITMHTHPQSMPPSVEDFNSSLAHGYKTSLVICHDGTIYEYTSKQEIKPALQKLYAEKYMKSGYTEKEAQLKGLEELKRSYNIDFWEVN